MAYLRLDLVFQFLQAFRIREQSCARTPDWIMAQILAWIALVLGVLTGLGVLALSVMGRGTLERLYIGYTRVVDICPALIQDGIVVGIIGFLVALLASGFHFLILNSLSEGVLLALSIEENTRETAYYLRGEGSLHTDIDTGTPLKN